MHGANPYALVGPGLPYDWPWSLLYPATAMIASLPLALFPQFVATLLFSAGSAGLLAFAATRNDWNRVPMFASAPFIVAAGAAQWSPLFTASLLIPPLAAVWAAKPTVGLAMAAGSERTGWRWGAAGALVLFVISLAFRPSWPLEWLDVLGNNEQIGSPVTRLGGVFSLLALLRWRRPEARLIVALALVPQTGSWYEALPLFLVPVSRKESLVLCLTTAIGYLAGMFAISATTERAINDQVGALMIATAYLPATIMVLRRPNAHLPGFASWRTRDHELRSADQEP